MYSFSVEPVNQRENESSNILPEGEVMSKLLSQLVGHWEFLTLNETIQHYRDGNINIYVEYHISQVHSSVGLCHSDDRLQMSNGNIDTSRYTGLLTEVLVEFRYFLFIHLTHHRVHLLPSVDYVLSQSFQRNQILFKSVGFNHLSIKDQILVGLTVLRFIGLLGQFLNFSGVGVVLNMTIDDERGKCIIKIRTDFVLHHTKNIKTRKDWVSEIYVIMETHLRVVFSFDRVGCCNHRASSLKGGHNTSLRYWDTLLFHGFVNRGSILFVHFIELID